MSITNKVTGDLPNITTYTADGAIVDLSVPGNLTAGANVVATGNASVGNVNVANYGKVNLAGGATIYSIPDGGLVGTTEVNSANDRGISVTAGGNVPGASYAQLQWVQDINNYDPYSASNAITNWVYVQNDGIYFEAIDNVNSPTYDYLTKMGIDGNWSMSGNVTAANFIGNGAGLTGLPASYTDANVAAFLASGNLTSNINSTADITANTVTANLFVGNFQGNVSGNLVVPGINTQVLFNNSGSAGADAGFTYNKGTDTAWVANTFISANAIIANNTVTANSLTTGAGNLFLTQNKLATTSSNVTIDPGNDGSPLTGNLVVLGNLSVSGNVLYNDVNVATTGTLLWVAAANANSQAAASGGGLAVGNALTPYATWTYNEVANSWQSNIAITAKGGANINGALTGATTGAFSGNVVAAGFAGNGSGLDNINPANIAGQVANALVAGTVYTNAQPNITSVGTLTSLSVSGTTTAANVDAAAVNSTFYGDGGNLTNLPVASIIARGASNVKITAPNGPIVMNVNGDQVGNISATKIALGYGSGNYGQLDNGIAIGLSAGALNQQTDAIAIGTAAAGSSQGANAVAIGFDSGGVNQGPNSVAIGAGAQTPNSAVVLNATGAQLSGADQGFYVAPVRNDTGNITNTVYYNTSTKEVTYGPGPQTNAIVNGTSNVAIDSANGNISMSVANVANVVTISTANISTAGNVVAAKFYGDGSSLTGLPGGTIALTANANVTLANLISTANVTDKVGATYVITNTSNAVITLNAGNVNNPGSFVGAISGGNISLISNQVAILTTTSSNVAYTVENLNVVQGAKNVFTFNANSSVTLANLLATNNVVDIAQNTYTINNTGTNTITITAPAYTGYQAYSTVATGTTIGLAPGAIASITTTTAGTSYQIVTISNTGSMNTNVFYAYPNNSVAVVAGGTVLPLTNISFDPANSINTSTNRFQPTTAGYYQVTSGAATSTNNSNFTISIRKNAVVVATSDNSGTSGWSAAQVSTVVYLNGSGDYLDVLVANSTMSLIGGAPGWTYFTGALVSAQPIMAASNMLARATLANNSQSFPNTTPTKVQYGVATINPRGWWNTSNSQFVATVPGFYSVNAQLAFYQSVGGNFTSNDRVYLYIYKNGVQQTVSYQSNLSNNTSPYVMVAVEDTISVVAGDIIEIYGERSSSGSTVILDPNLLMSYVDISLISGPPVTTGAVMQGTQNVFKAQPGGNISIPANTWTSTTYTNTVFDPLSAYNNTTGRFTPQTAGYYRIVGRAYTGGTPSNIALRIVQRAGGSDTPIAENSAAMLSTPFAGQTEVTTVAYFNGTTDYVYLQAFCSTAANITATYGSEFSAELIGGVTTNGVQWLAQGKTGTVLFPFNNAQTLTGTSSANANTIMTFTLSGAGTYQIATVVRGIMNTGSAGEYAIYDANGTLLTGSQVLIGYIAGGNGQTTATGIYTIQLGTNTPATYYVKAWASFGTVQVTSDSNGYTSTTWTMIGGNNLGNDLALPGNLSVTGNTTVATVSASGNITGAYVTAVGNVVGTNFIGNGAMLTGITATAGRLDITKMDQMGCGSAIIVASGRVFVTKGYSTNNGWNNTITCGLNINFNGYRGVMNTYELNFNNEPIGTCIDAGTYGTSAYALFSSGNLYTWGYNNVGQLGIGSTTNSYQPTFSLANVARVYTHPSQFSSDASYTRLLVKKNDGTVWGCGQNSNYELGIGNTNNQTSWTQISWINANPKSVWNIGSWGGAVIVQQADNSVWVSGYNGTGQLGLGSYTSPTFGTVAPLWQGGDSTMLIKQVCAGQRYYDGNWGNQYTISMLLDNGTTSRIVGSGNNNWGSLGTNNYTQVNAPVAPIGLPAGVRVTQFFGPGAAPMTQYALMANGDLYAWGYNGMGQVGDGTTTNRLTAFKTMTAVARMLIDTQGAPGWGYQTPAPVIIGTDGTVWSWGMNNYAQVGNGTWSSSNVLSPSRLPLPKGVTFKLGGCYSSGGNDAITRFLISTDNRIFAWGYNGSNAIDSTDGTSNYYYPIGFYPPNLLA